MRGGDDKQAFPMKQGVLIHGRAHLLLRRGHSCYKPRRTGERVNLFAVALWMPIAVFSTQSLFKKKKMEKAIPELTDSTVPCCPRCRRGSQIHFSSLSKGDARQYVVRKPINKEAKKPRARAPTIPCLVTPCVLPHKRWHIAPRKQRTKKDKEEAAELSQLLVKGMKEAKEKLQEQIAKRQRLSCLRQKPLSLRPVISEIF